MGRWLVVVFLLGGCGRPELSPRPAFDQDWALLFWIPYDNDLAAHAPAVLSQIEAGVGGARVESAAQVDLPGEGGMARIRFGSNGPERTAVAAEASAGSNELEDFLDWAGRTFEARRYGVIVLGHGGALGEIALDEHPGHDAARWMNVGELARAVERFGSSERGSVELVFLQSCARATIETAYELRHAARTILASQALLGAPNFYYAPVLATLGADPSLTGPQLARAIARSDGEDMFVSYTSVDAAPLDDLPARIDAAVEEGARPPTWSEAEARVFHHAGDSYMDAGLLLSLVSGGPATGELGAFVAGELVAGHVISTTPRDELAWILPDGAAPSGLSLRVSFGPDEPDLEIYRDSRLSELTAIAGRP